MTSLSLYHSRILLLLVSGITSIAIPAFLSAQTTGPTQPVIIEYADNMQGQNLQPGEEKIELIGNVRLQQGLVRISANRAIYYTKGDRAQLFGKVRIEQPGVIMTAPETDYNGATGIATAPKGVVIQEEGGTLEAGYGEYQMNRRISYFREGVTLRDSSTVVTALGGVYFSIERKAIFQGNVLAVSDSGNLTANELTYWRDTRQSFAVGSVRLESVQDASILTCDTLDHLPGEQTFAYGNVILLSEKESATLTGDTLRHLPKQDYTIVTGSPMLTQVDSTLSPYLPPAADTASLSDNPENDPDSENDSDSIDGSDQLSTRLDTIHRGDSILTVRRDTTTITANVLERFTGLRRELRATGNARMRRGTLEAVGTVARYFEDDEIVSLGSGRAVAKPVTGDEAVASDSNDVVDTSEEENPDEEVDRRESEQANTDANTVPNAEPIDSIQTPQYIDPIVWYDDSQLTGDTITVYLEEKKLRLIDVVGNAFAISKNTVPERYDQLASERLLFNVAEDTIRSVRAEGAAASIYFIYEGEAPNGLNRSSGDTIVIAFNNGQASRIGVYGPRSPLEGEVVPEKDVAGRENIYRLSGFQWQKEEKGTADTTDEAEPDETSDDNSSDGNKIIDKTATDPTTETKEMPDFTEPE